jgi:Fe2+ transport system protein B
MAKVKKTKKQVQKQLHPSKNKNNVKKKYSKKKKISKTKIIEKVVIETKNKVVDNAAKVIDNAKEAKVVQELKQNKVVENASKVATEIVSEAKETKSEITDSKKEMKFHPLLVIVVGVIIGMIPFFFYHPAVNSSSDNTGTDCTYGDWKAQSTGYCMYNDVGEYFTGDTVKYEYNAETQNCTRYTRTKTCQ